MKTYHTQKKHGFTLIEAMVGTGVFAIGVAGSVGLLSWIMQATASNGRIVGAEAAGMAQLEEMFNVGLADVQSGTGTAGQYDLAWTVTSASEYNELSVDVEWTNNDGRKSSVSLASMVSDETRIVILPGFARSGNGGVGGVPTSTGEESTPEEPTDSVTVTVDP